MVKSLKNIPFPDCYQYCDIAKKVGVTECDSFCKEKFEFGRKNIKKKSKIIYPKLPNE